jgi:hypothetical protein
MNKDLKKAVDMLNAAKPASGFRPETPQEWEVLQIANEEFGYAMFKENGMTNTQARQLAKLIYGGPAGRLLLEMAFRGSDRA